MILIFQILRDIQLILILTATLSIAGSNVPMDKYSVNTSKVKVITITHNDIFVKVTIMYAMV